MTNLHDKRILFGKTDRCAATYFKEKYPSYAPILTFSVSFFTMLVENKL